MENNDRDLDRVYSPEYSHSHGKLVPEYNKNREDTDDGDLFCVWTHLHASVYTDYDRPRKEYN